MTGQVRILIVEDESITLDALRDTLVAMGYAISGNAMRADEAIDILDRGLTDLVILDIHISGSRNGLWLGEQISQKYHIPFIFLTAYVDEDTIRRAAALGPAGYLTKPFVDRDVKAAIELAIGKVRTAGPEPDRPAEPRRLSAEDSIFVKSELVYRRLPIADILYLQSFRNYVEVHTGGGEKYVLRSTLKDFTARMPDELFFQTHRSYAVNLRQIHRIGGNFVDVGGGREIPLSRGRQEELLRLVDLYH